MTMKLPAAALLLGLLTLGTVSASGPTATWGKVSSSTKTAVAPSQPTLEEFLKFNNAAVVRERDRRRHNAVEKAIERCVGRDGFKYTPVPMQPPLKEDAISPAELARTSGFGVTASYLAELEGTKPAATALVDDPNVPYIESLGPEDQARFFRIHAKCANSANKTANAPIEAAKASVEPYMDATYDRLYSSTAYDEAMREWSKCIATATGVTVQRHDDVKRYVASSIFPRAERLAQARDKTGLMQLLKEEISLATAASECESARRLRVAPVVRQYESAMIREHLREFTQYRNALDGRN